MKNNYLSKIYGALLLLTAFTGHAQYTVSPIPHQAYTATLPVSFTEDDTFSAVIPLGFDFTFFGTTYNSLNISTNGYVEFGGSYAQGSVSPWAFNAPIPSPTFDIKKSFLGCYHDMNNQDAGGTITYGITGTAPYRKFVVIYNNNSHFQCGASAKTSTQMILYETLNILDSQIIEKQVCATWNGGVAVVGVIDQTGLVAITAPGRNTSVWTAFHEGWRFTPETQAGRYDFAKCDDDNDGIVNFDLQVAQNDLWAANPAGVTFHLSEAAAMDQTGAISLNYTNTANAETIYANANGQIIAVSLRVVGCDNDYDGDSVATADEDLNSDTNLANDDTDADGIPNFIDNDDDGDLILTNEEYVFPRNASALLDTDNDGIPNYLDNDDDGDGVLTINEDYNHNNNPADDDINQDGTADYLQNSVLGVNQNQASAKTLSIYPNPATDVLNIDNKTGQSISAIEIYSINGMRVKQTQAGQASSAIPVGDLQSGIYFVKIQIGNEVQNHKFIKK